MKFSEINIFNLILRIPQIILYATMVYLIDKNSSIENTSFFSVFASIVFMNIIMLVPQSYLANYYIEGEKLRKKNDYEEAIKMFEKSLDFYSKNKWVDKYRLLLFISVSELTFKERSLCGLAFCYSQLLNGEKAKLYFELTLIEFPKNKYAKTGLNFLNSGKNIN